jgi:hypothetical protein
VKGLSLVVACCAVAAPALAADGGPKIVLSRPLPSLVRVGQRIAVTGRVAHPPAHASAALQIRGPRPWATVAEAPVGARDGFKIRWRVSGAEGPVALRVVALSGERVIARTSAQQSAVGPKAVYCAPPVPPAVNIPAGDGWIVGGLYLEGGPFPGIFECEQQPYTINVESLSGTIVASQSVAAGHSYTVVVPAGTYKLRASSCGLGSGTVTAAHQTKANTVCPVP